MTELRPEVVRTPPRGNRFWLRLAALSFTVKLALLVVIFVVAHAIF